MSLALKQYSAIEDKEMPEIKTRSEQDYRISLRELDTIVAALRVWQTHTYGQLPTNTQLEACEEIAQEHGSALSGTDIGQLIERLNCQ